MLDDRHAGLLAHAADQALAAAGNAEVDVLGHAEQVAHGGPIGGGHQLHGVGRQTGFGGRLGQDFGDGRVGMAGLFAAAEDHGVARLDAEAQPHRP